MFGKLLKNDLKAQWHSVSTIFLAILILCSALELLVMYSVKDVFGIWNGKQLFVVTLGGLFICLALFFACIVILIAVGIMFSKTVYGKTGYLTLTLPVKTDSLIWSKTFSGLVWTYIVYFLFFGSFFLFIYQAGECENSVKDAAIAVFELLIGKSIDTFFAAIIFYLFILGIAMFLIVQCMYFAITCSNVSPFSKLGPITTVIVFFGSLFATLILILLVNKFLPFGMVIYDDIITMSSNVYRTKLELFIDSGIKATEFVFSIPIVMLLNSVLLSFPITYLTKHKVNVK